MFLGLVIAVSCALVVAQAPAPSPGYPTCNVCGQVGYSVTNYNATILFPGYPPFTCEVIQRGALAGFVNPMYCPVFPLFNIPRICGCMLTPTAPPTPQPTPPTTKPTRQVAVTPAQTLGSSIRPTFKQRKPTMVPVTANLAPVRKTITQSPTSTPTSSVLASPPSKTPVASPLTPDSPSSHHVMVTAAPIPAILVPQPTVLRVTPTFVPAPVSPTASPVNTATTPFVPIAVVVVAPSVAPVMPSLMVPMAHMPPILLPSHPTPSTTSISSVHSPTTHPAVPDLSIHPYSMARKRRPSKLFHIGMSPLATPTGNSISAHRPRRRPVSAKPSSSVSQPSLVVTLSPRGTHHRRPNSLRNDPSLTATPSRRTSHTRRHRRKPSAHSHSSTARDTSFTLAPTIAPKGTSGGTNVGKGNIFDRGQSPTKLSNKLFKDPAAKKVRG